MIFIEWRSLLTYLAFIILIALAISGILLVERRSLALRLSTYITLTPVAVCGILFSLLMLAGSGCQSNGTAIFSPDGKSAARLSHFDGGALGGDTAVELYTDHGLRTGKAYAGFWHTVEEKDLRWTSNTDLVLNYEGPSLTYPSYCHSAAGINVHCVIKLEINAPNQSSQPTR